MAKGIPEVFLPVGMLKRILNKKFLGLSLCIWLREITLNNIPDEFLDEGLLFEFL